MPRSGYYLNSLKDWKRGLQREQKRAQSRLDSLRGQKHPVADDQEALMQIREGWIAQIDMALKLAAEDT